MVGVGNKLLLGVTAVLGKETGDGDLFELLVFPNSPGPETPLVVLFEVLKRPVLDGLDGTVACAPKKFGAGESSFQIAAFEDRVSAK